MQKHKQGTFIFCKVMFYFNCWGNHRLVFSIGCGHPWSWFYSPEYSLSQKLLWLHFFFCKGWIILWSSMRLVAEEAEAMLKIIKSCASGHKAIKCRWTERNFAFPSNPFDLLLPPAAPPPPPEPDRTTVWEDQTTVPFTGNLGSCCGLSQTGLDPDSQKMRICQRRALFPWLPFSFSWLWKDFF